MFDYITGKVASAGDNRLVIDCGGVGFLLTASVHACAEYANKGSEAKVPVYLAVREDALELYGFKDENERRLFLGLIGVSGVGAKLAVSVLSGMPINALVSAIASGDIVALSSIKGVGKKTAERIALELKGKTDVLSVGDGAVVQTATVVAIYENALAALIGLGYQRQEAETAIKKAYKNGMTTEQIVLAVLHG